MQTKKQISLGEYAVSRIGLGTNRVTDTKETRAVLKRAVELGLNFIDTANIYTGGQSEQTIGDTLTPYPEGLIIATKGGMVRGAPANNQPDYLRNCIEESMKRLKTPTITHYQLHRVAPDTLIEETMNFFKQLQAEGKIKYIGLSEVTVEQIERARKIADIMSVQNHYNFSVRKYEDVVDYCEKNNIIFIPFFPLNSGKVTTNISNTIKEIAGKHKVTEHQIALAWLLKRSPVMLPIPGTLSVKHLEQNFTSMDIELSVEEYETLDSM